MFWHYCIWPWYPQLNKRQERALISPCLENTNRLGSASPAHVTAAAFPLLSNSTQIHFKISKSKPNFWQDLQDQICLLGIHLLPESLKRTMNDSQTDYQFQWVKVSKCNICLAGTYSCAALCSSRGHKNSQNEQDPSGALCFHRHTGTSFFSHLVGFFLKRNDWLKELRRSKLRWFLFFFLGFFPSLYLQMQR